MSVPGLGAEAARAADRFAAFLTEHQPCAWEQVGPCVWCVDHNVRLYQGDLPDEKRTTPKCAPDDHDWNQETGQGFYGQCRVCNHIEWYE